MECYLASMERTATVNCLYVHMTWEYCFGRVLKNLNQFFNSYKPHCFHAPPCLHQMLFKKSLSFIHKASTVFCSLTHLAGVHFLYVTVLYGCLWRSSVMSNKSYAKTGIKHRLFPFLGQMCSNWRVQKETNKHGVHKLANWESRNSATAVRR